MTNCPPIYRNLQCESFSNKKKITSQLLRQFCKNDSYLYDQIMQLWDATDPESRKRFYPPDFMDVEHSFGIESYILNDFESEKYNYWNEVYRFSQTTRWKYIFDLDGSNDKLIETDSNGEHLHDADVQYVIVYADSYLDVENNYNEKMLEVVNEDGITTLRPPLTTSTYEEIIHYDAEYSTQKENTSSKYVKKQNEKLGKAKRDAHFKGAFNNWDCNSHWYNGFNRLKNYNIKSKWRKNPDTYDIPSVCHAQTFKAENSGRLSKVNLNIQGDKNAVSPCIVEIRETTKKGYPSKKVLARTEKKFSGKGENIVAFEFKNKALIKKGESYAIVVRSPLSKFSNTYRFGGWTTGCFSSEKKYYGNGSAFTSEDNGKTWTKNGKTKDTKSYGTHWYDWGISQKPIDFAFEVFVQPVTQKPVKEKVVSSNAKQLLAEGYVLQKDGTYQKLLQEAYDVTNTYEYSYIQEGSYYLHLKPIQVNPIDNFVISTTFSDGLNSSRYWHWEYFDIGIGDWVEVEDIGVDFNNNITNYTILKLRIRCDIKQNTYIGSTSGISGTPLDNLIASQKLSTESLTYLQNATLVINTKKPTKAYLRTLYYHPHQDGMLGANIWSEIGTTAEIKGDANVEIDVVHETLATDHFKFYDLNIIKDADMNNLTELQEDIIDNMGTYINLYEKGTDVTNYISYTASQILDYVFNDITLNDGGFIGYLQIQLTPTYILPFYDDVSDTITTFFDKIALTHLPSYPINASEIGDDDIVIDLDTDTSLFTHKSQYGFCYSLDKNISNTLSSIDILYTTQLKLYLETGEEILDENGFIVNDTDVEERIEEQLKGIVLDKTLSECVNSLNVIDENVFKLDVDDTYSSVDYALTKDGKHIIFNGKSKILQTLFPMFPTNYNVATTLSEDTSVNNFKIRINLSTKAYQEFVDFEIDYDNGYLEFYNSLNLIHGDFNISYNPLWVRGLSVADFPLKMDLWKEKYEIGENDGEKGMFKLRYDIDKDKYIEDKFFEQTNRNPITEKIDKLGRFYYTFHTTVPARDNIRKLVINEGTNDERSLEEDSQFFVNYLTNEVVLYINDLVDGDVLTIHYTPNLTDDGLALAYRLKRSRYDVNDNISTDDDFVAQPRDSDDVYIGMNYFTYRT